MNTDFLPKGDTDLMMWYGNFAAKLPNYASTFGFTPTDPTLAAVVADNAALAYMVNQVQAARVNTQERVAYKDLLIVGPIGQTGSGFPGAFTPPTAPSTTVAPGIVPRVRALAKRLKANAAYTESIGRDLGIARPAIGPVSTAKPTGAAQSLVNSQVQIKFIKNGHAGICIESRRANETEWAMMGNYLRSPVMDTRSPVVVNQPELRSYRMRYLDGNAAIGEPSDILTVTTMP